MKHLRLITNGEHEMLIVEIAESAAQKKTYKPHEIVARIAKMNVPKRFTREEWDSAGKLGLVLAAAPDMLNMLKRLTPFANAMTAEDERDFFAAIARAEAAQ